MIGTVKNSMTNPAMVNKTWCFPKEIFALKIIRPSRRIFTLIVIFENGDEIKVSSDQTWTDREGSIKPDSVYNGEIYDSRNDHPNWSRPGFNWNTPLIGPTMNSRNYIMFVSVGAWFYVYLAGIDL